MPLTKVRNAVRFTIQSVGPPPTLSALAFTPTHIVEANALSNGAKSPLWGDDGRTLATDIFSASDYGTKCFSMSILDGETGFGNWGCNFNLPTNLVKGDSVHIQFSTMMPSTFDWTSIGEGSHLKYIRVHTQTSAGGNEGYNDLYIDNEEARAGFDGRIKHITEVFENNWTYLDDEVLVKNVWETFEMRIDFDDVPDDGAGSGRTRLWRNKLGVMTLIMDITDEKTLNSATSECDRVYLFTYWNGGAPQDNTCYMDRFIIETDLSKLVETDSGGTKIIGGLL